MLELVSSCSRLPILDFLISGFLSFYSFPVPLPYFSPLWTSTLRDEISLRNDLPVQFLSHLQPTATEILLKALVLLVSAQSTLFLPKSALRESDFFPDLALSLFHAFLHSAVNDRCKTQVLLCHRVCFPTLLYHIHYKSPIKFWMIRHNLSDLLVPPCHSTSVNTGFLTSPKTYHTYSCHRAFVPSAPSPQNSLFTGSYKAKEFTTNHSATMSFPQRGSRLPHVKSLYPLASFFFPDSLTTDSTFISFCPCVPYETKTMRVRMWCPLLLCPQHLTIMPSTWLALEYLLNGWMHA